ncbi:MAG TPA: hypothetical protein VGL83_13220 [Stellaceae bacterium]|jgi:hypothetical protein
MTPRRTFAPSFAALLALAAGACAAIYYGAVPWALGRTVVATLWLLGYR